MLADENNTSLSVSPSALSSMVEAEKTNFRHGNESQTEQAKGIQFFCIAKQKDKFERIFSLLNLMCDGSTDGSNAEAASSAQREQEEVERLWCRQKWFGIQKAPEGCEKCCLILCGGFGTFTNLSGDGNEVQGWCVKSTHQRFEFVFLVEVQKWSGSDWRPNEGKSSFRQLAESNPQNEGLLRFIQLENLKISFIVSGKSWQSQPTCSSTSNSQFKQTRRTKEHRNDESTHDQESLESCKPLSFIFLPQQVQIWQQTLRKLRQKPAEDVWTIIGSCSTGRTSFETPNLQLQSTAWWVPHLIAIYMTRRVIKFTKSAKCEQSCERLRSLLKFSFPSFRRVFFDFNMKASEKEKETTSLGRVIVMLECKNKKLSEVFANHCKSFEGQKVQKIIPAKFFEVGEVEAAVLAEVSEAQKGNHDYPGTLSLSAPTNKLSMTVNIMPSLDGTRIVLGRVIKGLDVLQAIDSFGSRCGLPKRTIFIKKCGILKKTFQE